jgi:CII-binding regulator of phage lambda lysogenization HflD
MKAYSGLFFERALPNEYLVSVGKKDAKPVLGGKKFKWFNRFIRVPAYVQRLKFVTDNANVDYQGIGIEGYATWRIDPERPEKSISTLDFFGQTDPMNKTNEELKTICIEAVRHVIANMSIDDALKKKDDIAENLKNQLKVIEEKWGIIFDQVGIEKVTVMSNKLFADLQSDFRSKLKLEAERSKMLTDREIAKEQNSINEKNSLEQLETHRKLELIKIDNKTKIQERELTENMQIEIQKQRMREAAFRNEMIFNMEQEEKRHELEVLKKNLELALNELETKTLSAQNGLEDLKNEITKKQLNMDELSTRVAQIYTDDKLKSDFITALPKIFAALKIENYSVFDSGGENSSLPVLKLFNELLHSLKSSGLEVFKKS